MTNQIKLEKAPRLEIGKHLEHGKDYVLNNGEVGTYDMHTDCFTVADGPDYDGGTVHRIDTWYIGYARETLRGIYCPLCDCYHKQPQA